MEQHSGSSRQSPKAVERGKRERGSASTIIHNCHSLVPRFFWGGGGGGVEPGDEARIRQTSAMELVR